MLTEKKKTSKRPSTITSYCFNDKASLLTAESAVNERFPGIGAYATERILCVPDHPSLVMGFAIDDYVKSLGGRCE